MKWYAVMGCDAMVRYGMVWYSLVSYHTLWYRMMYLDPNQDCTYVEVLLTVFFHDYGFLFIIYLTGKRSHNTASVSLGLGSPTRFTSSSSEQTNPTGDVKNSELQHVDLDSMENDNTSSSIFTSRLSSRMSLTEKLELTFGTSGFLLREILLDFCSFLSKVLVGSHNQELLMEGLSCLKSESVVELVMLLCSQEWQNSLQRHAGSAFMDLINEGRMVSHATRERLVLTTSEALFILQKLKDVDGEKHEYFQNASDLANDIFVHKGAIHEHITSATHERDENTAKRQFQKVKI